MRLSVAKKNVMKAVATAVTEVTMVLAISKGVMVIVTGLQAAAMAIRETSRLHL